MTSLITPKSPCLLLTPPRGEPNDLWSSYEVDMGFGFCLDGAQWARRNTGQPCLSDGNAMVLAREKRNRGGEVRDTRSLCWGSFLSAFLHIGCGIWRFWSWTHCTPSKTTAPETSHLLLMDSLLWTGTEPGSNALMSLALQAEVSQGHVSTCHPGPCFLTHFLIPWGRSSAWGPLLVTPQLY